MKPREMVALLEKNGFVYVGSNGSHRKYKNQDGVVVIVPYHAKELKKGDRGEHLEASWPKMRLTGGYTMKNIFYPAVFHPEEVGYSVTIPDIDGCFTQGDTMDEALEMAQDAIGLLLEDQKDYPAPSDIADIKTEAGDFVAMVPFNWAEYKRRNDNKAVKKTLTIPSWLNEAAEAAHINFSGVLQDALLGKLNTQ